MVIEALKERNTIEQLAAKYELHPNQITAWKREFLSNASLAFSANSGKPKEKDSEIDKLYAQIGQLTVENHYFHTRYVLHWSISNTMTALWIRKGVSEAIARYGYPEIINSDQGSQFTSDEYTSLFTPDHIPTRISMDGKGRCIDHIFIGRLWRSVKYECVYLHAFEKDVQLFGGFEEYFRFYNTERGHQSPGYKKPFELYTKAAWIMNILTPINKKEKEAKKKNPTTLTKTS